jgi:hypothetical protein
MDEKYVILQDSKYLLLPAVFSSLETAIRYIRYFFDENSFQVGTFKYYSECTPERVVVSYSAFKSSKKFLFEIIHLKNM